MNGTPTAQVRIVTVATTSPLKVRELAGRTPITARVVTGSSYSPTAGDSVVAVWDGTEYRILGK